MANYRLSKYASEDYESIYVFGLLNFGLQQADAYAEGMEARFEEIAQQPTLYPTVDHVKTGYRLSVYRSHSIYYCFESGRVLIVRILHSQDVAAALSAS